MSDKTVVYKRAHPERELLALCELFKTCFGDQKLSEEYLRWLYLQNPDGEVIAYNAWSADGLLVGHYALVPRNYVGDAKYLLSVNTATHPEYGRRGIFGALAERCYEEAETMGYAGVVGVANKNSIYTFQKKLNFEVIGSLKFSLIVGRAKKQLCYLREDQMHWRLGNPSAGYVLKDTSEGPAIFTKKMGVLVHLGTWVNGKQATLGVAKCKSAIPLHFAPVFYAPGETRWKASIPISSRITGREWHVIFRRLSRDCPHFSGEAVFGLFMDSF